MRHIKRLLIFWAISAPLFWFFGMPYLLQFMDTKTQEQNGAACHQQLAESGRLIAADRTDAYCACLNEALHFEREDLFEMAQTRKPPARINTALQAKVDSCSPLLDATVPLKQPDKTNADGSIEIHL